ncbi:MAG: LUD domain-containing protein [Candidatus Hydrogenedentes bacterium]|nr:LUD domain-containing protein [Candidatus Hydrogenedentota bacterium]
MPAERYVRLGAKITESIENPKNRNALYKCMKRGRDTRSERLKTLPGGTAFRDEVKAIKERCIAQQDELLARFIANAEKRGATVFVAEDARAAIDYTIDLALRKGCKNVAKSKSLTTEEIEINHDMIKAGLSVVETDLGELIIQLVDEKPYHLVFPSVHKMREDVAEIFSKATGKAVSSDIPELMKVVRAYLRPIFLGANIGMTGANVGIAETGAIVIETNEGNARLVSSIGETHICIMGIEKIVDTVEDAMMLVLAHPVSASGQLPTTYVTMMAGRCALGQDGAPRESHIIVLDNGRRRMREHPLMKEALHCIRCGACMNVCPTYGVVGGHTFGYIYPGPIGIPWTAEVHGQDKASAFAELCISCGLCKEICPAQIDMPMMIAEVKRRDLEVNPAPVVNRALMAAEKFSKLGSATAPLSNWSLKNPLFRTVMEKAIGIDKRRVLPPFARDTFAKRFARRFTPQRAGGTPKYRVAFFHDLYANYNRPDLAMKAVERLEAAGCEVVVPKQEACGYPYIGYGDLDAARTVAARNVAYLRAHAEAGGIIVTPEPTAAYCFKVSYPKLLPHNAWVKTVAAQTRDLFELLLEVEAAPAIQPLKGRKLGFHCPCHQRPIGMGEGTREWLRRLGAEVQFIDTGTCCGMAGTFGMKHGPLGYDLANAVGDPLFEAFKASGVEAIVTESSVCSMHLREGANMTVYHPLDLLGLA